MRLESGVGEGITANNDGREVEKWGGKGGFRSP